MQRAQPDHDPRVVVSSGKKSENTLASREISGDEKCLLHFSRGLKVEGTPSIAIDLA